MVKGLGGWGEGTIYKFKVVGTAQKGGRARALVHQGGEFLCLAVYPNLLRLAWHIAVGEANSSRQPNKMALTKLQLPRRPVPNQTKRGGGHDLSIS